MKIFNRLEEAPSKISKIEITKKDGKLIYATKENHLLILIVYLILIFMPLIVVWSLKSELNLIVISTLIICSFICLFSYIKGSFQTNNVIEISIENEEIHIKRNGFFGKLILKEKIIKSEKDNELLLEKIPLSSSLDKRITLKTNGNKIPLFDLECDTNFDQIFLSLQLLVKGDKQN